MTPIRPQPARHDPAFFGHERWTVLEPRSRFRWIDLRELWAYRELFAVLVGRDVRVRYKQAALGAGWAILRPAIAMAIFTVIFGRFARLPSQGAPYPMFVLAGLLPWTYFSSAVAAATESLVGAQSLVTKVYFPRLVVPLVALGTPLVDLAVALPLAAAVGVATGRPPGWSWLWLPAAVVFLALATVGVATLLAALNVQYRDVRHLVPFALQVGLYATPVVFPATLVPERFRAALFLNPAAGAVELFRAVLLDRPPDWLGVATSAASAIVLLVVALAYFSRVERRIADVV